MMKGYVRHEAVPVHGEVDVRGIKPLDVYYTVRRTDRAIIRIR